MTPVKKPTPFAVNSSCLWRRLVRTYGVDRDQRLRALRVGATSMSWLPFRVAERVRLASVRLKPVDNPIFIVGHWRCGTTHLHNLLTCDPNFGSLSTYEAFAPACSMTAKPVLRPLMAASLPERRPMDNMAMGVNLPQEDEFAVCCLTGLSFYLSFFFPRSMDALFDKFVIMEALTDDEWATWKTTYRQLVAKTSYLAEGRQLVLKNPVNVARIPLLLELFPDARFIHIVRNPYHVYRSTIRLFHATMDMLSFQRYDAESLGNRVLRYFEGMMQRFLRDRSGIPPDRLIELRYEDLTADPLATLAPVYEQWHLPDWDAASCRIEHYLEAQRGYTPNRYDLTEAERAAISARWGFALEHWGYEASVDRAAP